MRLFTLAFTIIWAITGANASEYHVDLTKNNLVRFISDAPLEDFDGTTNRIDGYIFWQGNDFPPDAESISTLSIYFEVDLNSLDTGIGLRNWHMRENYLETDHYPYASYSAHATKIEFNSDSSYTAFSEGVFAVHGVEKPLEIECKIIPQAEGFHVICRFEIELTDYNIKIPKLMFMKLDETIRLELDFYVVESSNAGDTE